MPVLAGIRVLVVDDDPAAREMVMVALEHCGAEVAAAASAEEAREKLSAAMCDVFLIDVAMPGEDGYALIQDIRTRGVRQPAAALTAQAREADRDQALSAGFDMHIAKPVEAQALARAVAALITKRTAAPP
jgi:CheY-like chemotaxis protein